MTFAIRQSPVDRGRRPTVKRWPRGPGIPRWASPWIATATYTRSPIPPCATGWTPPTRPVSATRAGVVEPLRERSRPQRGPGTRWAPLAGRWRRS